jgi:hypothetical protein
MRRALSIQSNDTSMIEHHAAHSASHPADRRSGEPDFAPERVDDPNDIPLSDTTSIRHGAQAVTGKATWSAGQMGAQGDPLIAYERARMLEERRQKEARELANLTAWNAQMTVVGGVQMTNEQAQDARRRVIANDDRYADWAVANGHISGDERDEFKRGIRRKTELEDKRGRGTLSEAEAREESALDRSRVGKAVDAATAQAHLERSLDRDQTVSRADANTLLRPAAVTTPVDNSVFQDYVAGPALSPPAPLRKPRNPAQNRRLRTA